ncbi:hypothetical protein IW152_006044 [Coemansia sp. BCRC 34962]|nr:hypothetical protein IW152_006044 [Coemansia sp. BCRC 34962]
MSQASSRHQPPQQQSRDTGNTDRPGYYKEDIPSASRRFNVRRTVFLRIPYKATSICDSIRSRLAKFGEIADMLELGKKGVCYVMFYDSRDAANAISMLTNNFYVAGEDITIVESRLRPNAFGRCPLPTDYQATVLVSLVGAKRGFEDSDRMYFERYGEVHAFYPYYNSESEWVIEYYDCRSAADAAMNCHGQAACKGTIYTTFLWDDSVPRLEQGPTLASKRLRPEATHDSRVDTRTENNMSFDKATLRSANAAMFIREPRQNDDLYHAREREQAQAPSLQKSPPPMSANDSNRSSVVLPSMAQPLPQPNSAPASTMVPLLPGTKKRPSAAKWMDSAVSSTISRSGSMDAVRKGADQAADLEEVKGGMSPRGEPAPATLASNMNVVLSRLALDPNVEQRARAAREILQQHQGLLGLGKHPAAAPASSSPSSVLDTLPNRPNTVSGATMSGASAVSALNQLVSRAPRHDSQSTMVADISPLIPSKDMSKTLGGLLDYPPSTAALTESASAAANAVRRASRYDPVSLQAVSATSTLLSGFDTESLSATAVSAMASSVSKHGYYAQKQHYQNQERKRPLSIDNSEGVNSLLGILAQVRKNGGTPADTKKR